MAVVTQDLQRDEHGFIHPNPKSHPHLFEVVPVGERLQSGDCYTLNGEDYTLTAAGGDKAWTSDYYTYYRRVKVYETSKAPRFRRKKRGS
jgi:hypothetical protein